MNSHRLVIVLAFSFVLLLAVISPLSSGARAPQGPFNLVLWDSGEYVQLAWDNDPGANLSGYNVYRATGAPEHWQKLNEQAFPLASFVDYSAPRSELVFYRVSPVAANGAELPSASAAQISTNALSASPQLTAQAVAFDQNNIITDAQLINANTMSVADIQSFLVSKGSVLANFSSEGKSAAQRIYDDCQTHGVNPQVVLVTLQKEKGLITSSTANPNNLAMGWNTIEPTTTDFANQIYYGTRQFRRYYDNLISYGWTVGQPHTVSDGTVTSANTTTAGLYVYTPWIGQGGGGQTGVGGNYLFWDLWYNSFGFGDVTASISQPEFKLPLPAGKDWLLSVETGTVTSQCTGGIGGRFYGGGFDCLHAGRSKYSLDLLDNNLQDGELTGKASVDVLASATGTVTIGSDPAGYGNFVVLDHGNGFTSRYGHLSSISVSNGQTVSGGAKIGVMGTTGNSTGIHVHFELRFNNEGAAASSTLDQVLVDGRTMISYKVGTTSSPTYFRSTNTNCTNSTATLRNRDGGPPIHPPGSLLKIASNPTVYLIDGDNKKRAITSAGVLAQLYNQSTDARTSTNFSSWVITVGQDELDLYEQGGNLSAAQPGNGKLFPDGKLIGLGSEVSIVTGGGKRRPFVSGSTFTGLGFNFCQVVVLTATEYNSYPVGPPVEAMPLLTSSVNLNVGSTATVGQSVSGNFTIKNVGTQSLPLTSVGIGGRLNGNPFDISFGSTTLSPGSSFTYNSQSRQLTTAGTYTFFAAYQENNAHWAISVPAAPGVTRSRPVTVPNCTFSISPLSQNFPSSGGSGSVSVSASSGCAWTATSNSSFITINSGGSGSGNGTVNFTVSPNTSTSQRSGLITVAGKTFNISQDGASPCSFSITPQSQNFGSTGGFGSVSVTAGSTCSWTASSNSSFITITSGSSGTGNGSVNYTVTENTSQNQRSGTMSIAGQSFTVTQDPAPSCNVSISPQSQNFGPSGGTGSVNVTAGTNCPWSAQSNDNFITITSGSSGSGSGTVNYSVGPNSGTTIRFGSMTIAGQGFSVTQDPPAPTSSTNVALAANGATATASSTFTSNYLAGNAINGERAGANSTTGGVFNGWISNQSMPQWLQIDFGQTRNISEIDVFMVQDNYQNPSSPTLDMTFTTFGLFGFDVQYWNGSSWLTVPGGTVSGNNKVWRQFTFAAISTNRIRVLTNASPDNFSRLVEVEAWTTDTITPPSTTNVALPANGGVASASSTLASNYLPGNANNGERAGANSTTGGVFNGWIGNQSMPQWLQIDFGQTRSIIEIDVFMVQDNYQNPSPPTQDMTFTTFGLNAFDVQYWNGSSWVTVPGGSVTGNNKVWRQFTFTAISTSKIRVLTNASPDNFSRLVEVEAWSSTTPPPSTINVALPANGGIASASTTLASSYLPSNANNGERAGANSTTGGVFNGWISNQSMPQWLEVDFGQIRGVVEIDVFMVQDNYQNPSPPTLNMTFSTFGLYGFDVQYWNGSSWVTVPGGSVTGNNKVWRQFTFPAITTSKIRVLTNASPDNLSRLTEVEAWAVTAPRRP